MTQVLDLLPPSSLDVPGATAESCKRILASDRYHADRDVVSCSMLKPMLISPAHYISALLQHRYTPAMKLGTVFHTLVLEPHTLNEVVAVFPDSLSSTEGKQFVAANPTRICLSLADLLVLQVAAEKVRESRFRGRPFYQFIEEGEAEPSFYYTDPTTGIKCRSRLDLYHPDFTFDLKTTSCFGPAAFQQSAIKFDYDMQAFMYSYARCLFEGTNQAKPFVFVALESSEPHSVFFMPSKDEFIGNGCEKYKAALAGIKACSLADSWPTPEGEFEMDLAPWQVFKPSTQVWAGGGSAGRP